MKIEVRQDEAEGVIAAFKAHLVRSHFEYNVAVLAAVNPIRSETPEIVRRFRKPRFQVVKCRLGVGLARHFHSGKTGRHAFGLIGHNLNLAGKRVHVWGQPVL